MAEIIICYHEKDKNIAENIAKYFESKKHLIHMDKIPFQETIWEGGWTEIYPKAESVVFLITNNFVDLITKCATDKINKNEEYTIMIWSSKNGHPVKRLLPDKNYFQNHLGFCFPEMSGDDNYYKTFRYI